MAVRIEMDMPNLCSDCKFSFTDKFENRYC